VPNPNITIRDFFIAVPPPHRRRRLNTKFAGGFLRGRARDPQVRRLRKGKGKKKDFSTYSIL
jgi:hypothetical protein